MKLEDLRVTLARIGFDDWMDESSNPLPPEITSLGIHTRSGGAVIISRYSSELEMWLEFEGEEDANDVLVVVSRWKAEGAMGTQSTEMVLIADIERISWSEIIPV